MTEEEWLVCDDLQDLIEAVRRNSNERKWRHHRIAPVAEIIHRIAGKHSRHHIELLEQYADGVLNTSDLDREWMNKKKLCVAFKTFGFPWGSDPQLTPVGRTQESIAWSLRIFIDGTAMPLEFADACQTARESAIGLSARQALNMISANLRDIFGNPFRPVTLDPRWQSETVVALATGIYAERAFDRMPVLADALEEAGCDHADVLNHCRGDGPHFPGCWVVDLLLCKE